MGLFSSKPATFSAVAAQRQIICPHCGNAEFWQRRVKLNSTAAELFDVGWASEDSLVLTCTTCTHMSEFMPDAVQLTRTD